MKCNNCDTDMDPAYIHDSDGYDCGVVSKFVSGFGYTKIGELVYCPKCGNLQVDIKINI